MNRNDRKASNFYTLYVSTPKTAKKVANERTPSGPPQNHVGEVLAKDVMHKVKLDRGKLKYVLLYVKIDSKTQSMVLSDLCSVLIALVRRQGNNLRAEETKS